MFIYLCIAGDVKAAYDFIYKQGKIFMPPAWKVRWGHLVIGSSVCLSVPNSLPLTNKVQYFKFGWWCSNQTWTVVSSMDSSHFTDITFPWGSGGVKMFDLEIFAIFWLCCHRGNLCFINTCLVKLKVGFVTTANLVIFAGGKYHSKNLLDCSHSGNLHATNAVHVSMTLGLYLSVGENFPNQWTIPKDVKITPMQKFTRIQNCKCLKQMSAFIVSRYLNWRIWRTF